MHGGMDGGSSRKDGGGEGGGGGGDGGGLVNDVASDRAVALKLRSDSLSIVAGDEDVAGLPGCALAVVQVVSTLASACSS